MRVYTTDVTFIAFVAVPVCMCVVVCMRWCAPKHIFILEVCLGCATSQRTRIEFESPVLFFNEIDFFNFVRIISFLISLIWLDKLISHKEERQFGVISYVVLKAL